MWTQYCFQYAITCIAKCRHCKQKIAKGAFRVKRTQAMSEYHGAWYHFDCFWKQKVASNLSKYDIKIQTRDPVQIIFVTSYGVDDEPIVDERLIKHCGSFYVDLDTLDTNGEGLTPVIQEEDIERIRQNFVLVSERRTPYYIPTIVRGGTWLSCPYYLFGGCDHSSNVTYYLEYHGHDCHPECLAASGKINIDAKDFENYDILSEEEKRNLDRLFKKDDDAFYYPKAVVLNFAGKCKSLPCKNLATDVNSSILTSSWEFGYRQYDNIIKANEVRICYGSKTYHSFCFGAFNKFQIDAKDVAGYDTLDATQKAILNQHLKKTKEYDDLFIQEAEYESYCCAKNCLESGTPSKFPYRHTILPYEHHQIIYQNKIYHPKCLKATGKVNIDAKDIKNYDLLSNEERESLDQIFKKVEKRKLDTDQPGSDAEAAKENDEPVAKKSKNNNVDGELEIE